VAADPPIPVEQASPNVVTTYQDGVKNQINAIQWNGDPTTQANILAWTKRAHVDKKGHLKIQNDHLLQGVGLNDWLVMDSRRYDQVFPMTNPQFRATYQTTSGSPIP